MIRVLSSNFLASTALSLVVATLSLFFHFDLTDEAYYLYYLINPSEVSINFYHALLNPIGSLWGHEVIGYRILNLSLITFSSLFFVTRMSQRFDLRPIVGATVSASLLYFTTLSTISYNSLTFVAYLLTFGLIVTKPAKQTEYIFFPLLIVLATSCRSTQFIILSSYILILGWTLHKKVFWKSIGLSAVLLGLLALLNQDYVTAMFETLIGHSKSVHSGILTGTLQRYLELFLKYFLPWSLVFLLTKRFFPSKLPYFYAIVLLIMTLVSRDLMKVYKLVLALSLLRFLQVYKKWSLEHACFIFIGMFTILVLPIGTNNNIIRSSMPYVGLALPFFYLIFEDLIPQKNKLNWIVGVAVAITLLIKTAYFPYRNPDVFSGNLQFSDEKLVKGIFLSEAVLSNIKQVRALNIPHRKVFAYVDSPFVPVFSGRKAFGTPWYFSDYKNPEAVACEFISHEAKGQKVIIARTEDLLSPIKKCLIDSLGTLPETQQAELVTWTPKNKSTSMLFEWDAP